MAGRGRLDKDEFCEVEYPQSIDFIKYFVDEPRIVIGADQDRYTQGYV